jgi:hypothetical protein
MPPVLFCPCDFNNRVSLYFSDCPIYASDVTGMTGTCHQLLSIEVGSHKLFLLDCPGTTISWLFSVSSIPWDDRHALQHSATSWEPEQASFMLLLIWSPPPKVLELQACATLPGLHIRFWKTLILFYKMAILMFIPTNSVQHSLFSVSSPTLANYHPSDKSHSNRYEVISSYRFLTSVVWVGVSKSLSNSTIFLSMESSCN